MAQAAKKINFTDEQKDKARRAFADFEGFCEKYLYIQDFEGKIVPLKLNKPQRRFVKTILKQWKDVGFIRVVIAKARKMGFSTVITAFIFWRLVTKKNIAAIAGTHHEDTNEVLVDMFKLFFDNYPEKLKPTVDYSNASGMGFRNSNTYYKVRAASNAEKVGRGPTVQMIHVSEIAHIDNAGALPKSLFSAVGHNVPDSMIFLESTANGMGNYHHNLFTDAEKKAPGCKYIAFFAAWHEDDRYREKLPVDFIITQEELEEKKLYGLDDEQVCWRRSMLASFDGTDKQKLAQFRQEYPANSTEAFQFSAVDSFIESHYVIEAMNRAPTEQSANTAVVAAFDPSDKGKDRDAFILRHGSNIFGLETPHFGDDFNARVRFLQDKLDNKVLDIDMLFIDYGAGSQIYSELKRRGYSKRVCMIEFGAGADNQAKAGLKRDEMFVDFVELLSDKHNPISIKLDEDQKAAYLKDLTATGYTIDSRNRPKMESKQHIKSRTKGMSTDLADASIMLVAMPVKKRVPMHLMNKRTTKANSSFNAFV
jgi:hypothetical protein